MRVQRRHGGRALPEVAPTRGIPHLYEVILFNIDVFLIKAIYRSTTTDHICIPRLLFKYELAYLR